MTDTPDTASEQQQTGPRLAGLCVLVAGAGTAGVSAADYLLDAGAQVILADDRFADPAAGTPPAVEAVVARGAATAAIADLLADPDRLGDTDLLIVSPGFSPTHPLPVAASEREIPVWGEVELAWRVDRAGLLGPPRTWLVVTGTNGKTTTTSMLADIVAASGRSGVACGNIGLPVLDAMRADPRVDVLCAELSSFQLHWAPSVAPDAGVVLNVADDHLDWHGGFDGYAAAKAIALHGPIGVVGLDDPVASTLPVAGRRVGFTLHEPEPGELGIVDGQLVDRAFTDAVGGQPLGALSAIHPPGPPGLSDALGAAALALAAGVGADDVTSALAAFRPAAHRGEVVARVDGIDYVDDSKATNPHAAQAAVAAHRRVVLIAGGLLKGASLDGMLTAVGDRLAGVVAIGRDRNLVAEAIARHAPEVPTVTVFTGDDGVVTVQHANSAVLDGAARAPRDARSTDPGTADSGIPGADPAVAVMDRAVREAWRIAAGADPRPDAVLLAPAAASLDMFAGYGRRGDAFSAAANGLPGAETPAPVRPGGDA